MAHYPRTKCVVTSALDLGPLASSAGISPEESGGRKKKIFKTYSQAKTHRETAEEAIGLYIWLALAAFCM
jgi:hypothetical protein